jgi:hypothetical protein
VVDAKRKAPASAGAFPFDGCSPRGGYFSSSAMLMK